MNALLNRRQALAGTGLAVAGALLAGSLAGRAHAGGTDAKADSTAQVPGAAKTALPSDVAVQLNEVAYPEPIASGDYEQLMQVEDANPLDDALLDGLAVLADNLACYGLGQVDAQDAGPNACLSPASLYLALALLAQGAAEDTQAQLLDALGMGDSGAAALAEQCANLMRVLWARTTPDGDAAASTLRVANSVWMNAEATFEQAFLDVATTSFFAECFGVKKVGAEAGQLMGSWISEHTGATLAPTIQLDDGWVASLINTVWFKDGWLDSFDETATEPDVFHAQAGDVTCDFMTQTRTCTLVPGGSGYALASLPLATGANLTFLLPDEDIDVRSFFGRAAGISKMFDVSKADSRARVTFVVPKVSFDATTQLADICKQLGVVDAFGSKADFSELTAESVLVSSVEQGTHFSMNEKGVEASAYTVIAMATAYLEPDDLDEVEFRLDRPFAFRLTDPHDIVLFEGIVGDPTAA